MKAIIEITVTFKDGTSNKHSLLDLYKRFKRFGMSESWLTWFKNGCVSDSGIVWAEANYKKSVHPEPETYLLPSIWASYLINADPSGLEDSDIEQCDIRTKDGCTLANVYPLTGGTLAPQMEATSELLRSAPNMLARLEANYSAMFDLIGLAQPNFNSAKARNHYKKELIKTLDMIRNLKPIE